MIVARSVEELPGGERTVAIGSFDGVHRGHLRVLETARDAGGTMTVVTFWPHPRLVLGNRVELLSTLERRLELLEAQGVDEVLVVAFTPELAALEPEQFAESLLRRIGTVVIVVGAARLLSRPAEVEGTVTLGDQRGGTLGFRTANLAVDPELLVPAYGIYAGAARGWRAAISIGVNPHYGGDERRIEPHLLDFEGDLYGQRLVVELWQRLRDERAFGSEADLVAQIARDVEAARAAERPV